MFFFVYTFVTLKVTLWEIFNDGMYPWGDMDHKEVKDAVSSGIVLDLQLVPERLRNILLSTWEKFPDERPSFEKILKQLENKREDLTYSTVDE